jgi:hypothetical protein
MKLRDIIAVPFWAIALVLDLVAVTIGGSWTAKLIRTKINEK